MSTPTQTRVHLAVTPEQRVREYGDNILIVRYRKLQCKSCMYQFTSTKKSVIDCHIRSLHHQRNEMRCGANRTLDFGSQSVNASLVNDLILTFARANIPLEKLANEDLRKFFIDIFE